jgi:PAS domain S-box-containing protein
MATGQKRHEEMSREELIRELEALRQPLEQGVAESADELLRESLDRYADLYEFAPCGYVTLDASGTIVEVNHTAAALLRSVKQAIEGMPLARWVAHEDRRALLEHLRTVRAERVTSSVELDLEVGDDRRRVHAELISKIVPTRTHQQIFLRSILLDLTERDRARAEEERLRAGPASSSASAARRRSPSAAAIRSPARARRRSSRASPTARSARS